MNDPLVQLTELADLLSASLGLEKANDLVHAAARDIGLAGKSASHTEAMGILEAIAKTPGLVGITARCAKARLSIEWGAREMDGQ